MPLIPPPISQEQKNFEKARSALVEKLAENLAREVEALFVVDYVQLQKKITEVIEQAVS